MVRALQAIDAAKVGAESKGKGFARVFEGREPAMDQVKRELYEYWKLLEAVGEGG